MFETYVICSRLLEWLHLIESVKAGGGCICAEFSYKG